MTNQPDWIEDAAGKMYRYLRVCEQCEGTGTDWLGKSEDKNVICPHCKGTGACVSQEELVAIIREACAKREVTKIPFGGNDDDIPADLVVSLPPKHTERYVAIKANIYAKQEAANKQLVKAAKQVLPHLETTSMGWPGRNAEALMQAIADAEEQK